MKGRGSTARSRWAAWLPLALFLFLYFATVVLLERSKVLVFTSWSPFLLMALCALVWQVHLRGRRDLGRVRGALAVFARLALFGALVAALAEPRTVRADERLSVVFAVDHSASIQSDSTDRAIGYVLKVASQKPERDEAALLFFGRNAGVELPPAMSLPFESINVEVDRDGTDLAEALSSSAALLPPDRPGRIVLISDGVATEGDLEPVLDDLRSRGIAVDVVPIDYDTEHEVWLEKLELPRNVKLGETVEPAVVLSSLTPGEGVLTLEERGEVIARQPVRFAAGKSRFTVPVTLQEPGYYEFVARITVAPERDRWAKNNVATASLELRGKGRVLLVVDPDGDPRDYEFLERALREHDREVEVLSAIGFPRDPLTLLPHDCIVFVNAPRDALDEVQMQAAHDAVFDQGSGFLMVGGQQSFGPGGYHMTRIEELLPVSMDMSKKKVVPKGALAIVLHTCEFAQGNTWGKRITLQAIKVLNARDEVGVLVHGYQGGDGWLFPLTPAGEYDRLAPLVNNAQIGDMPGFGPTMQLALTALGNSDASQKHVIIISDGDPSAPAPGLLAQFQAQKVSVSTVTVFPHGGRDLTTMQQIAAATGGRHYQPNDPARLPAIFIKEAKTLRRNAIQNVTFTPFLDAPSPVMKGIAAVPPLHGYVMTTPKARSLTILEGPEEDDLDPVLVRWRYGVGQSAAFTSDLSPGWGRDWVGWDHYQAFVNQLITDIARVEKQGTLGVSSFAGEGRGVVQVDDFGEVRELLDLRAVVDGPGGTRTFELEQIAPRRYEARFPLDGVGRYRIVVAEADGAPEDRVHTGFAVPFSQEYLRFRANRFVLEQIADRTAGRVLRGDEDGKVVFIEERTPKLGSAAAIDWLLALVVLLIPLEAAVRKLQLDMTAIARFLRRARATEPDATMRALLARKGEVAAGRPREAASAEVVAQPSTRARAVDEAAAASDDASTPPPAAPTARAADQAADGEDEPASTTGRLLRMKQRRSQEGPGRGPQGEDRED